MVSGSRGSLYKFAIPSTQCVVYLLRNLWSKFGSLSDEYRQLKFFGLILSYVNLVAPPLSANKHRNRSEQLRGIRHTLNVVGPRISLDGWQ